MTNPDQFSMGQIGNMPMAGMPQTQPYPQAAETTPMDDAEDSGPVYPEIFYKLSPYISMACDLMASYGIDMPTQRELEETADGIFDDFCAVYPEMAAYMNSGSNPSADDPPPFRGGYAPRFAFRRRGIGRDFIEALLLSELLGRGGYFYY